MNRKLKIILLVFIIALPLFQGVHAQTQMLWSKPPIPYEENNFNQNQYECPIWTNVLEIFDLYALQGENEWIWYNGIVVKDFNNDGFCDLFFPFNGGGEIENIPFKMFFYNPISGELEDKTSLLANNIGNDGGTRKVMTADFNGDGILDIVIAAHPEAENKDLSYLDILLSNDSGWEQINLSTATRFQTEGYYDGYYHGFALGDVDNDGDIDIIVGMWSNDNGMITYKNDGLGNFSTNYSISDTNLEVSKQSFTLELEDINLDGYLDLIYWGYGSRIAYGKGDGTFGDSIQEMPYGDFEQSMDYDFIDFDNDGDKDLIITETLYEPEKWQLIFLKNNGIDTNGKIIYEDITEPITTYLKQQNFYLNEASRNWVPYIQILDLNKDGILDIIAARPFEGENSQSFYPQNWVLMGEDNLMFKYVNYPITAPISNSSYIKNLTSVDILFETRHLTDVYNPFSEPWTMDNLRGEIDDWVVYYRQSPFGDKSLEGVKRITISNETIIKEFLGENVFKYTFNFQPEFEGNNDIYARITYVDEYGVENILSEQIQFSVTEFDFDQDGVLDVNDTCLNTPLGETVNINGCSDSQLADEDGDGVANYLDECPDTPDGEKVDDIGCVLPDNVFDDGFETIN